MAKQIKVLKCPHCGNSKPTPIGNEHYRCSKCATEFFLDSDEININVNHRYEKQTAGKSVQNGGWVWVLIMIVFILFVSVRLCISRKKPVRPVVPSTPIQYNKYLFSMMLPINGKGVAFSIEERKSTDSVYAVFRDIDNGTLINEHSLVKKEEANSEIVHRWFLSDSAYYLILNRNRICTINPAAYTCVNITSKICASKPALEAGIMSAQFVDEEHGEGFKLQTNLGKDLLFFPVPDLLCTNKAFQHMVKNNMTLSNAKEVLYYLFLNKESSHSSNVAQLFEIKYQFNGGGPENKLTKLTAKSLQNLEHYAIQSCQPITEERVYFDPQLVYYDSRNILITYRPTLAGDAQTHLQLLDIKGDIIWTMPLQENIRIPGMVRTNTGFIMQLNENTFCQISSDGKNKQEYKLP